MKRFLSLLVLCLLVFSFVGTALAEDLVVANLPKSVGGAWFNRMAVGIEKYGKDTGAEAFQTGADIAISSETGQTYTLKSTFTKMPPLKQGFMPDYLAADHLPVDPEGALT